MTDHHEPPERPRPSVLVERHRAGQQRFDDHEILEAATKPYVTLGDIAGELTCMRSDGVTREAIEYALEQVYG